jgi:T3SS negative regulator,GrlR
LGIYRVSGRFRGNVTGSLARPPRPVAFAGLAFSTRSAPGCIVPAKGAVTEFAMKNGLYSIHIHMLDGVKGRDSGVLILHDGAFLGGGPYFWSTGSYTAADGTWKGHLRTNQHTPFPDPLVRPLFGGQEVNSGFSGTYADDQAEVFGTTLVGTRSLSFRATLKRLAD